MRHIKHVSFDLDGTLINSFPVMKKAWEHATAELSIKCGFSNYKNYVGLPFPKIMEQLGLEAYERDLSDLYFATTKALRHEVSMIDGASDLLSALKSRGYSVSIITSKPRMNAELVVEQMGFEYDLLVCGDDYIRGKPDPIAGRDIFKNFDVKPAEVLYVGDMIFDFQFALNSGMDFVFFGDHGQNRLPSNLCNSIREIAELGMLIDVLDAS